MDWEEMTQPKETRLYAPMMYTITLLTILLMVAIKVGKYRQNSMDRKGRSNLNLDTISLAHNPENLESSILNFTLLLLINVSSLGYIFFWEKIPPDDYANYPNWLIVYFLQIITPMLG